MATINDLSFRIIKRILAIILLEGAYSLGDWKKKLPYIGVCQSWRYFGLNFVYNRVFFIDYNVYLSQNKLLRQRRGQYFYRRSIPHKRSVLVTNIELFIMMNRCDTVRRMYICANSDGSQSTFLDKVFELLQQTQGDWIRLNWLNLRLPGVFPKSVPNYASIDYKDKDYDLGPIVEYARSYFTEVTAIFDNRSDTLIDRLIKQLCFLIASRSDTMIGDMSQIASSFKHLPQNISHLTVSFDKTDKVLYLPFIYAESLQNLVLKNLPPRFDWTCFSNSAIIHGGKIVFQRLENLFVYYNMDNMNNGLVCDKPGPLKGFDIKFAFPRLSRLSISDCIANSRLLHSDFPNRADLVQYIGSISSIALCQQMKIKSKVFRIRVTAAEKQEQDIFYDTMNGIFKKSNRESDINIGLKSIYFPINIDPIKWEYLNALAIDCYINFSSLVMLLQKLAGLKYLYLYTDSLMGIQETINIELLNMHSGTDDYILCKQLEIICLNEDYDPYKHQELFTFITFLITCCPTLKNMRVNYYFKTDIEPFLKNHSATIPTINKPEIDYWCYYTDFD